MWITFSFITALLETSKDVIGKKSSLKINEYVSAFALQLFAALVLLPFVIINGVPELKMSYFQGLLVVPIAIPLWSILYMKALKLSPLYICIPMLAFNPVFASLLSIFFDHRWPTSLGWSGIVLITAGLYLLRLSKVTLKKGVLYPILNIINEPGAIAMLGVTLIWSFGAHINKLLITGSSPLFFAFTVTSVGTIVLFFIAIKKVNFSFADFKYNFLSLGSLGILNGLAELTRGYSLQFGYTPYVVAITRTSILTSSLAGKLFFGDRFSKINLLGIILMFSGILLLVFFP